MKRTFASLSSSRTSLLIFPPVCRRSTQLLPCFLLLSTLLLLLLLLSLYLFRFKELAPLAHHVRHFHHDSHPHSHSSHSITSSESTCILSFFRLRGVPAGGTELQTSSKPLLRSSASSSLYQLRTRSSRRIGGEESREKDREGQQAESEGLASEEEGKEGEASC